MKIVEVIDGPHEDRGFIFVTAFVSYPDGHIEEEQVFYDSWREAYDDLADLAEGNDVFLEDEFLSEDEEDMFMGGY